MQDANDNGTTSFEFCLQILETKVGVPAGLQAIRCQELGLCTVVRGLKENGDFIVNDPYGSVNDGYSGPPENGKGAVYSRKMLTSRWLPEGPTSGWGRKFQP